MPPSRKRSYAASNNAQPPPTKRSRPVEVTVLSSDSKPETNAPQTRTISDDSEIESQVPPGRTPSGNQPQRRSALSIMEGLRRDAFWDLKTDLCLALDSLDDSVDPDAAAQNLRPVLQEWVGEDKASRLTNHLCYRLDNKYHEEHFRADALVGRDQVVVGILDQLMGALAFDLFVALLDRDDADPNESYLVSGLMDQQGHRLLSDIPVDETSRVQLRLPSLQASPPMSEAAIVLVPRDCVADFLVQYAEPPAELPSGCCHRRWSGQVFIEHYTEQILESETCDRLLPVLRDLFAKVRQLDEPKGLAVLPEPVVQEALEALLHAQDWEFLDQAASLLGSHHFLTFFERITEWVSSGDLALEDIEEGLLAVVLASPVSDRCLMVSRLPPLCRAGNMGEEPMERLAFSVLEGLSLDGPCTIDGPSVLEFISRALGPDALVSRLPPLVEKNATHTAFVLRIMDGLRHLRKLYGPSPSSFKPLFQKLATLTVKSFDVPKLLCHLPKARSCDSSCSFFPSPRPSSPGGVNALQLSGFVSDLLTEKMHGVLQCFMLKIVAGSDLIRPEEFTSLWLPFLGNLVKVLEKHHAPLSTPRYRHLFAAILEAYLACCVGTPPTACVPQSQRVFCRCRVCDLFQTFLRSDVSVASFSSISDTEIGHINEYLSRYAQRIYRCQFKREGRAVVVRKREDLDAPSWRTWADKGEKAAVELDKLDGPALRTILGDDYSAIFDFEATLLAKKNRPVPIEDLTEYEAPILTQPKTLFSTVKASTAVLSGAVIAPGANGVRIKTEIKTESREMPQALATLPPLRHGTTAGYNYFASELGARLRELPYGSFATPESIQVSIMNRWEQMSAANRKRCEAKAAGCQSRESTAGPPAAVPFNLHKDRLSSTPKPSSPSNVSPNQSTRTKSTWRGPRPPASIPAPWVSSDVKPPTALSPRALAPLSSSRLNSAPAPRGHPNIKTEPLPKIKTERLPQATSRGGRMKVMEIIDLTGDSD